MLTCIEEKIDLYWGLVNKPEGKDHLEDLDIGGIIILKIYVQCR